MAGSKGKVLVAMSGGVDSSVAAALLQRDGYEVVGCFMRLGSPGESLAEGLRVPDEETCDPSQVRIGKQGCCSINDAKDAQAVAARLDIPFYVLNFKRDFGKIIRYFTDEYNAGRTPNPCVRCNNWLKFGKLADYARSIDARFVASGHYARMETIDGRPALLRGVDESKDQSYVLFGVSPEELSHTLLPVGGFHKTEIRALAEQLGLPVFDKPDSQEICFVPSNNYMDVVGKMTTDIAPGPIVDPQGNVLGEHEGHQHFTVGQRRGVKVALGYPIYVVNKDAASNTITVGPREMLASTGLVADETNWLVDPPSEDQPLRCDVKIRYNAPPVPGTAWMAGEDELRVDFDEPQDAVAPGQAVVCYDNERVLGGGWIARSMSGND
jgi:tRNA-specific 2-thiouridylase